MRDEVLFGRFRFSLVLRRLWFEGTPVRLKPKEAELLAVLAERRPQIVSRDKILERVWPGYGSEAALSQTTYRLRKALQRHHTGSFIETLPDIGLRLIDRSLLNVSEKDIYAVRPLFPQYQKAVALHDLCTERSLLEAISLLESICEQDSNYLPAHEVLAGCYADAGTRLFFPPQEAFWRARTALQHVISTDPSRGRAFATLSTLLLYFNGNVDDTRVAAECALVLDPQSSASHNAAVWERLARRDFAAALTQADIALGVNPTSAFTTAVFGTALYMAERFEEAHRAFDTALMLNPSQHTALFAKAKTYAMEGEYDRCRAILARLPQNDAAGRAIALEGYVAAKQGNRTGAKAALQRLGSDSVPAHISMCLIELALQDDLTAAATLERALHTREPGLFLTAVDPLYAPLRVRFPGIIAAIERGRAPQCDRCGDMLEARRARPVYECEVCLNCQRYLRADGHPAKVKAAT